MNLDLTIVLPSIRPRNLIKFYKSLQNSCKKYSFELIIASPYLLPEELMTEPSIRFVHTYSSPTVAFQMATLLARGRYLFNTSDDGLLLDGALDLSLDFFSQKCSYKDRANLIYIEGVLDHQSLEPINNQKSFDSMLSDAYWIARSHGDLQLPGIKPGWRLCSQFLMFTDYFYELGGYDCQYEFNNHAVHDLSFRSQANGSVIYNSKFPVYLGSHCPGTSDDHAPVHYAQLGPDSELFNKTYIDPDAAFKRIKLDYNNWKSQPTVWKRRFSEPTLPLRK